jgi:hypothetical protein
MFGMEVDMPKKTGARMVDSPRARLWLAQTRAKVRQLSKELKRADDAEAFALLYELRVELWYHQEDFACSPD